MSAFDHRKRRKAIWLWNHHNTVAEIADLMRERTEDVREFLETCRDRGYPGRIDVQANRRSAQDLINRRTSRALRNKLVVFEIRP